MSWTRKTLTYTGLKSKTTFYATIDKKNNIQYYIKKITAKNGNKEISSNAYVNATGLGTSLEENSEFSTIVVELTNKPYYAVTPAEGLAISNTDCFVVGGTTYFHPMADGTWC